MGKPLVSSPDSYPHTPLIRTAPMDCTGRSKTVGAVSSLPLSRALLPSGMFLQQRCHLELGLACGLLHVCYQWILQKYYLGTQPESAGWAPT